MYTEIDLRRQVLKQNVALDKILFQNKTIYFIRYPLLLNVKLTLNAFKTTSIHTCTNRSMRWDARAWRKSELGNKW
jgi:hypothetical protein